MNTRVKWTLLLLMAASAGGCSSFSKAFNWGDSIWGDRDYRKTEAELAESLDVPPTLARPTRQPDSLALLNPREAALFQEGKLPSSVAEMSGKSIPAYRARGVEVKGDLAARWLVLSDVDADTVWDGVQKFLRAMGYGIEEANRATGIIRTEYVQRKEIVPLVDVSPLTRLFNKWRPETAEGALDRFTAHVTVDGDRRTAKVVFHHHQVFRSNDGDIDVYLVRPYDPVKELETLYQAAIFFGASKEAALKQVQVSAHMVDVVKGQELQGLRLHAPLSQSWAYLQSMVWRADWNVEQVVPERHEMVVSLQADEKAKQGFWSRLAFWRKTNRLPRQVRLKLQPLKGQTGVSLLTVHALEGDTPLNAEQRQAVFRKLGLLAR